MNGVARIVGLRNITLTLIWVWLLLFVFAPTLMVVIASLLERGESQFVIASFTLENFQRLFDPLYFQVFWNSIYLALVTTLICLLLGYPFAWLISRASPRLRPLLLVLVIIPFWTSSLIRTYAMVIILKANGLLNASLLWLGVIDKPLMLLFTEFAVIVGLVYSLLPFMILPLYAAMEKLDIRLLEAARDLGAGRVVLFTRVVFPLTLPGAVAGCMLVFLPALGMFYIPDLLGGAKILLLGNLIKDQFLAARDWPFGSAVSVMLLLFMVLFMLLLAWARRRRADTAEVGL
jgi:spermidine/putrescine transport system permease protein